MKFNFSINPRIVDGNGNVHMHKDQLKKVCDDVAEKAHSMGKAAGIVIGATIGIGVYMVLDGITQLITSDNETANK